MSAIVKTKPVFFGVEISEYGKDCDVLEISMKCGSAIFNKYIDPTKPVDDKLTEINHLTVIDGQLHRDGILVPSQPLRVVLEQLLRYLKQFHKPCNLIGFRQCYSNASHLIRMMKKESMVEEFSDVIAGFTDTFFMFKEKFPNKGPDQLNLLRLAKDTNNMKWPKAAEKPGRSAKRNAELLENLTSHYFSFQSMWEPKKSFTEIFKPKFTTPMRDAKRTNRKGEKTAKYTCNENKH